MTFVLLGVGLVLLMAGGSLLVKGASDTALALGVSPLMIGLTLVGFGTSAPELVTSIQAALDGSPGIAVGNVVGSNICNVLLILGLAAVLSPIVTSAKSFRRDGLVLGLSALACLGVVLSGQAGRLAGVVLLGALVGYIWWAYRTEKEEPEEMALPVRLPLAVAIAAAGLVLVVLGARWLVQGAVDLASALGVSDTLIGLTIVAVGTSLPEMATSLVAAIRGNSAVAIGNVVGSNIFNILGILGITAIIAPLSVDASMARFDIPVMLAVSLLLAALLLMTRRINRATGAAILLAYAGYTAWLFLG